MSYTVWNPIKTVGKWEIFHNNEKTEIMFTNQYETCYAYFDSKKEIFYFDRIIVPNYVQKSIKNWAKKNMISIYN